VHDLVAPDEQRAIARDRGADCRDERQVIGRRPRCRTRIGDGFPSIVSIAKTNIERMSPSTRYTTQ
jgi:hypothetical protein